MESLGLENVTLVVQGLGGLLRAHAAREPPGDDPAAAHHEHRVPVWAQTHRRLPRVA